MNRALRLKPQRLGHGPYDRCWLCYNAWNEEYRLLPFVQATPLEGSRPPTPAIDRADPTAYVADVVYNLGPVSPEHWAKEGQHRGSIKGR